MQTSVKKMNPEPEAQLLDAAGLLKALFPETARPTIRWLRLRQKLREIPFVKIGHLVFFDPRKVRAALEETHTIQSVAKVRGETGYEKKHRRSVDKPTTGRAGTNK